jgi:hypothetical protein
MYTKARLDQNALEASTWTKEASAPYPPALRLTHAAMFAVGEWTGLGFYGLTVIAAALVLVASAWYFLQTRWYVFPLLYLNFAYFADRFVYVQDGSYLVMLALVMAALVATRLGRGGVAPLLMAVATAMKLLPLYYARHVLRMPRRTAWRVGGILVAGLVLPAFVWDGYVDIYRFANERKGNDWLDVGGALLLQHRVHGRDRADVAVNAHSASTSDVLHRAVGSNGTSVLVTTQSMSRPASGFVNRTASLRCRSGRNRCSMSNAEVTAVAPAIPLAARASRSSCETASTPVTTRVIHRPRYSGGASPEA